MDIQVVARALGGLRPWSIAKCVEFASTCSRWQTKNIRQITVSFFINCCSWVQIIWPVPRHGPWEGLVSQTTSTSTSTVLLWGTDILCMSSWFSEVLIMWQSLQCCNQCNKLLFTNYRNYCNPMLIKGIITSDRSHKHCRSMQTDTQVFRYTWASPMCIFYHWSPDWSPIQIRLMFRAVCQNSGLRSHTGTCGEQELNRNFLRSTRNGYLM